VLFRILGPFPELPGAVQIGRFPAGLAGKFTAALIEESTITAELPLCSLFPTVDLKTPLKTARAESTRSQGSPLFEILLERLEARCVLWFPSLRSVLGLTRVMTLGHGLGWRTLCRLVGGSRLLPCAPYKRPEAAPWPPAEPAARRRRRHRRKHRRAARAENDPLMTLNDPLMTRLMTAVDPRV
jgi:hypothetical protein